MKGALVEFMPTFLGSLPNIIVFQINPETMVHRWSPAAAPTGEEAGQDPLAVRGLPGETFSFTLMLDSNEDIIDRKAVSGTIAQATGVYSRLATVEMLLYPTQAFSSGLLGSVSASLSVGGLSLSGGGSGGGGADRSVPASQVPIVLFVWGIERVVPVRVTSLNVTERLYDSLLNPTHAEAQIEMRVLTQEELESMAQSSSLMARMAKFAYTYTLGLRQALAVANLGNAAEAAIEALPL